MSCPVATPGYSRSQSYAGSSHRAAAQKFQSQIEQEVINAQTPIQTHETERINAAGYSGIYLNKREADQYRGQIPIEQIKINEDPNPEVIKKRLNKLKYKQEVSVKYLQPPAAPKPGDLIIREKQQAAGAAPPVVLRQEGQGACTPPPLVYREQPPPKPCAIPEQVVEVEGDPLNPPARRVVVEKLSNLPQKPQNILIEKWLPYKNQKRRVRYEKGCGQQAENVRNLVIEWEAPEAEVEQVCVNLGVENADPEEYIRRYGSELKQACEMPQLCQCEQPPRNPTPQQQCRQPTPQQQCRQPTPQQQCQAPRQPTPKPAANNCNSCSQSRASNLPELEGDIDALRRVDLEKYGLGGYRRFL